MDITRNHMLQPLTAASDNTRHKRDCYRPEAFVNPQSSQSHSSVMIHFIGSHQALEYLHTQTHIANDTTNPNHDTTHHCKNPQYFIGCVSMHEGGN